MSEQQQRRVVVGVDGSKNSERALAWAAYLARQVDAEIEVVTAWNWPTVGMYTSYPAELNPGNDARKAAEDVIDAVFRSGRPASLTLSVCEDGAAHALLKRSKDAWMVIVGSRGHGGFAGLLLGSVSAAVAEHCTCPVLVVHDTEPPTAVGDDAS